MSTEPPGIAELADAPGTGPGAARVGAPVSWWISIFLVLIGVLGGGVYGALRPATYTAAVDVAFGTGRLASTSVPGYVQALEILAGTYSRTLASTEVLQRTARETGLPQLVVRDSVTASPVPDSSVIRVEALGLSSRSAVKLVNATAAAFVDVTATQLGSTDVLPTTDLEQAELAAVRARQSLNRVSPGNREARAQALARVRVKEARAEVLRQKFQESRLEPSAIDVSVIQPATEAVSDKRSRFLLWVILGGMIGVAAATALHVVRTGGRLRR